MNRLEVLEVKRTRRGMTQQIDPVNAHDSAISSKEDCIQQGTILTRLLKLSKRETQIKEYIVAGAVNSQIAESLFITESTVKFHCSNIYRKLGIKNRIELIVSLNG